MGGWFRDFADSEIARIEAVWGPHPGRAATGSEHRRWAAARRENERAASTGSEAGLLGLDGYPYHAAPTGEATNEGPAGTPPVPVKRRWLAGWESLRKAQYVEHVLEAPAVGDR
jgi:hypothetical protein